MFYILFWLLGFLSDVLSELTNDVSGTTVDPTITGHKNKNNRTAYSFGYFYACDQ